MDLFLSYCFDDEWFVQRVSHYLAKQGNLKPYVYANEKGPSGWRKELVEEVRGCEVFVLFVGKRWGDTQGLEANASESESLDRIVVRLPESCEIPRRNRKLRALDPIIVARAEGSGALTCAREIALRLTKSWIPYDGLPIGYPFAYEKDIIDEYVKGKGKLAGTRIKEGCSQTWPVVPHVRTLMDQFEPIPNPVPADIIGDYRLESAHTLVDAGRKHWDPPTAEGRPPGIFQSLTFPEAGPRSQVCYPTGGPRLGVGILVTGGIAPGINAVIAGIVERHHLYHRHHPKGHPDPNNLSIHGYRDGFEALLRPGPNYRLLTEWDVRDHANLGGSMLGTSRTQGLLITEDLADRERLIRRIIEKLDTDGVDILYIIGGDGSMRAAHAIWTLAQEVRKDAHSSRRRCLSVVAIPKTMDNDILWVWQSFGFLSAVEKAKDFVLQLHTESQSNPRLCVMQLFGSDSGFVVSHTALASGACDAVLIPEVEFSMSKLAEFIFNERLKVRYRPGRDGTSPYGMILMAETAIPVDVQNFLHDPDIGLGKREVKAIENFLANGRRVHGQTPDELRTGGLKIVSQVLQREIRAMRQYDDYWRSFRVFTSEPRHLLRAIPPSASDVIFGHRLGSLAVDNAMAGYTDFMISQWLTEYVLVPLQLVVLGRKRVPQKGIFWKSVLANTGQPASMK